VASSHLMISRTPAERTKDFPGVLQGYPGRESEVRLHHDSCGNLTASRELKERPIRGDSSEPEDAPGHHHDFMIEATLINTHQITRGVALPEENLPVGFPLGAAKSEDCTPAGEPGGLWPNTQRRDLTQCLYQQQSRKTPGWPRASIDEGDVLPETWKMPRH